MEEAARGMVERLLSTLPEDVQAILVLVEREEDAVHVVGEISTLTSLLHDIMLAVATESIDRHRRTSMQAGIPDLEATQRRVHHAMAVLRHLTRVW